MWLRRVTPWMIPGLLGSAVLAGPSAGEQLVPANVEELVAEALERSPALAALRSRLAVSREMERPAAALPDPMVEAMLQNAGIADLTVGQEEMSMAGFEVRQDLPRPGKRRARGDVAQAESALRRAELAALERRVAAEVRRLAASLYALDEEWRTLAIAGELLEMLSATAAVGYAAGEAEQEALVKVHLSVSRLAERRDDVDARRSSVQAELNRWLDRPGGAPLGELHELPPVSPPPPPWEELALAGSPEVAVGRAAVALAEKRATAADLDLKADFSAAAGLAARGGLDPVLTLRFGVALPFWKKSKQEPLARAAAEELEAARQELRDEEASARSAAARLSAEWHAAELQVVRYREGILPQSSTALDAARASYLEGRGDFSTVIEDFNLWLEARVELARREADRLIAWAELERLTATSDSLPTREDAP